MFIVYENIEHNEIKLIILILWHFIRYSTILDILFGDYNEF